MALASFPVMIIMTSCAGPQGPVSLYQGPDRPGGEDVEGPAPPSDYLPAPTEPGYSKQVLDTNGDRRPDRVEYRSHGEVTVVGEDTNRDGKIDVYRKFSNGSVVDEVRDRNFDGIFDERRRYTNGDGGSR